jgi:hypothetical protein
MNIRALSTCLFIACGLWACTQTSPEVTADPAMPLLAEGAVVFTMGESEEVPAFAVDTQEPTPAMLEAARSGDPEAMRDAAANLSTCHAAKTCPGYGACTGWSALAYCNDTCTKRCCHDGPACNEPDIGGTVYRERYRICFNSAGASCTEWNLQAQYVCGC